VVGQAELTLELRVSDALVQVLLASLRRLAAGDLQKILLSRNGDVIGRKARDGEANSIVRVILLDDVAGREIALALKAATGAVQNAEEWLKADA
jgi:hypothetical protein